MSWLSELNTAASSNEQSVYHLMLLLFLLLVVTRAVVLLARRVRQTEVAAEILAGIMLGPSLLGALAPGLHEFLVPANLVHTIDLVGQIGLVLLMFRIGLEFDLAKTARANRSALVLVSGLGIIVPFVSGYLASDWFWRALDGTPPDRLGFRLFFAVAMSITAIPILGRILMEFDLTDTPVARIALGAASIDDIVGWFLLGIVGLIATGTFSWWWVGWRAVAIVAFFVGVVLLGRFLVRHIDRIPPEREMVIIVGVLAIIFLSASITAGLGIFAAIGGFVVGVVLRDVADLDRLWNARVDPLNRALLMPVFFVSTGLRTDIGTVAGTSAILATVLIIGLAFVTKLAGAYTGARIARISPRDASAIAVCMNTRALMELVVVNAGLELGVLPTSTYSQLVIMAIASTVIASPLIQWILVSRRPPVGPATEPVLPVPGANGSPAGAGPGRTGIPDLAIADPAVPNQPIPARAPATVASGSNGHQTNGSGTTDKETTYQ